MNKIHELIGQLCAECEKENVPLLVMAMPDGEHLVMVKHNEKLEMPENEEGFRKVINQAMAGTLVELSHRRILDLINGNRSKDEERAFGMLEAFGIEVRKVEVPNEVH